MKNPWKDQPKRVEVWSEKGTVRGTLAAILDEFLIPFRVLHGYNMSAGRSEPVQVIYVGDFDPSGLHMSEVDGLDGLDTSFWVKAHEAYLNNVKRLQSEDTDEVLIEALAEINRGTNWRRGTLEFKAIHHAVLACQYLRDDALKVATDMKTFMQDGLAISKNGRLVTANYDASNKRIVVNFVAGNNGDLARIAAFDPIGRGCKIDLT